MNVPTGDSEFEELAGRYFDEVATPDEIEKLDRLLASDPAAAEHFARMALLHGLLRQNAGSHAKVRKGSVRRSIRRALAGRTSGWRIGSVAGMAAGLLLAIGAVFIWWILDRGQAGFAELEAAQGQVELLRNGKVYPAAVRQELMPGDGIETGGAGRATFRYAGESTRIEVAENSRIVLYSDSGAKRLAFDRGTLKALVAPQPPGRPMVLVTAEARAEVVGTRFTLAALAGRTRLEVQEGQVRLGKPNGAVAEVQGGWYAVADAGSELVAKLLVPASGSVPSAPPGTLPSTIRFDFEDGQGSGEWTGTVVAGPERPGSRHCIKGQYVRETRLARVNLMEDKKGLFTYRQGAVLSFDYWIDDKVSYIHVYVWNRTQGRSLGYLPMHGLPKNRWGHVTIPLARLGGDKEGRLGLGDLITQITIQTGDSGGILYADNVEVSVPEVESF